MNKVNSKEITTVKLSKETKSRLEKLKEYERESFEMILRKILYILNICKKNPEKAQKLLIAIDKRIKRRSLYNKVN